MEYQPLVSGTYMLRSPLQRIAMSRDQSTAPRPLDAGKLIWIGEYLVDPRLLPTMRHAGLTGKAYRVWSDQDSATECLISMEESLRASLGG